MTSALKNRLVGTIIVVALVVILLPELLDGEKQVNNQAFLEVPEMPPKTNIERVEKLDVEDVKASVSRPDEIVDEAALDSQLSLTDDTTTDGSTAEQQNTNEAQATENEQSSNNSSSSETPVNVGAEQNSESDVTSQTSPVSEAAKPVEIEVEDSGWVVQLGSFSNQANVRKLLRTLTSAGYRVYSRPIETPVGKLTKVFVGPELQRDELEKALPHLKELTGLSGKITEFEVSAQ